MGEPSAGRNDESVEEVAEVSATEGRIRLTELMNRAFQGERIVLTNHGRRVAAIIGMVDFERLRVLDAA